ncbi:MAG TPA: sugar phosphate nucleotidyltransferase, partial [Acidimicrobiales bacterium]|nr:sugar phosphate nucleotidyltransferase [Acidimicrobiales bacterium]
ATLAQLVRTHRGAEAAATLLTAELDDPWGYGRIVRSKDGRVAKVVEQADADADEQEIREVNTSIYCFRRSVLAPALRRLSPDNAKGEYYLTDAVSVLHDAGYPVVSMLAADITEAAGVNDRSQLAAAESELRSRTNERWMRRGVTMVDPEQTYLDSDVVLAQDVTLFPGTILQGKSIVKEGAEIGPNTRLVDCTVGTGAKVSYTVGNQAEIGDYAVVGPFVVLAPGSNVGDEKITGSFSTG